MAEASPYDAVPYPARAFAQTHPDRLATLATLFGLAPAPPARCTVLELGCGAGANLLPMAVALPQSRFVGIDTSRRSIERAQAVTAHLGLRNVRFEDAAIEDYDPPPGGLDYVIAHGVYSWVPEAVRERLLAICAAGLSEHGVAYVSYNALPGGHARQALRRMIAFHVGDVQRPDERIAAARGFLALLSAAGKADATLARTYGAEAARMLEQVDGLFFHDTLAEDNHALYFHEFAAEAAAHELQFLAEAEYSEMQLGALPAQLRQALLAIGDPLRREQYLDLLKERMFRQTLLCRASATPQRPPRAQRLAALAASAALQVAAGDDGRVTFRGPGDAHVTTDHPLVIGILGTLADAWPHALPIADLAPPGELEAACETLLRCYEAKLVGLHVAPPAISASAGARPRVSALARLQAAQGEILTTPRHTGYALDDDLMRRLVALLDGTRDRAALLDELGGGAATAPDELAAVLERRLERLAGAGLLLSGDDSHARE